MELRRKAGAGMKDHVCGPDNNEWMSFFERRERYYRRQCLRCGHAITLHTASAERPCPKCPCSGLELYDPKAERERA